MLSWQLKLLIAQVLRPNRIGDKPVVTPDLALSVHQTVNMILESWEKGKVTFSFPCLHGF